MLCNERYCCTWFRIGSGASVLSALLTLVTIFVQQKIQAEITPFGISINRYEKLFFMFYAISLMIVPFALWFRIENPARKWKARVCNFLTIGTVVFAISTYSILLLANWLHDSVETMYIPARILFEFGTMGIIVLTTLCMSFMGWSLWDGGFRKIGAGALFLAVIALIPLNPVIGESLRFIWLFWLAKWFLT